MQRLIILLFTLLAFTTFQLRGEGTQRTARLFNEPSAVAGEYTGFCQDHDGFLWIGTDRGLMRFDGNVCDIYVHNDEDPGSLSDSRVLGVICDSKGRVWVGTANGLNLYDANTDTFKIIKIPQRDFYGYIIALCEQTDGTVTFIVSGVGLYFISENKGDPVAVRYLPGIVSEKEFNSIVCAKNGRLYLGTHDGSVASVASNGQVSMIKVSDTSYIRDLAIEEDGNILVSTLNDVYRIEPATDKLTHLTCASTININRLSNSANGRVYVATAGDGLWEIPNGSSLVNITSDLYCPFMNLNTAKIGAVYSAPDGNLWLGCNYYGIVMVPGRQIPFLYRKLVDTFPDFGGGLSALSVWQGNVLAGLDKGRLALFSPDGKLKMHTAVPTGGLISSIEVTDGQKALIGVANEGVWELDLSTGGLRKMLEIPGKYPSVVICEGKGDDLFIGVHGAGLLRYNRKSGEKNWLPYDPDGNRLTNPYITSLQRTPDNKIWIGLYGGIACYDLNTDTMLEINQEPFLKGATFAFTPSGDGSVMVGTSHGLMHFHPQKGLLRKYTTSDGLTDNDVRSIVIDDKGGKWIGTMRGLSYMTPSNDKILSYYGGYGLVETTFNNVRYSPSNRRVYLGSNLGITSFRPDSVPAPGFGNDIKVSALYLNGQKLSPSSHQGSHFMIDGNLANPDSLYLPYKDNALTLCLSTMDFRDASNVRYIWRLHGNDEWMKTGPGENLIYLPHMDPGEYDLEIAALENNVTSATTHIRLHISTPWYMSGWAKLIYLLVFITLLVLGWLLLKKKREEKINDAKIKFFIDVSHDIRSPMTLILSPLESLLKEPFDSDVRSKLQLMHRNAQRILSLVNQLLEIRKLEKGKMRLSCKLTNLNSFVQELVDMFRTQAADKKQTLTFEGDPEMGEIWLDRDNFDKILVNLISNAIKYTPDEGKIDVQVSTVYDERLGPCASVSVKDTGIGLDSKTQARIFDRFYRVNDGNDHNAPGFGIGLDLCRRLVELHHGEIKGSNREDGVKGSIFTVLVPIEESYYADEELIIGGEESELTSGKHLMIAGSTHTDGASVHKARPSTMGKRVLIVDDDTELRDYLSSYLGQSYKVKSASNGVEALKIVSDWQPDLIISDVMMPEMDGLTLLKRLKSNTDIHHIPVVLLSSKTAIADRMQGWDRGADGYLGKPFSAEELESLIDTLIDNRLRMKGKYSGAQDTEGKIEDPNVKGNDEQLLERIIKVINIHIDDPQLNVEKLSLEVGVSRAHLHRKMKDLIGMTPSDYIRNIRIRRACIYLRKRDLEVTQAAYKVGFTSQSHFSTHFKRYTGFTPSEYRVKCLSGNAPELPDPDIEIEE